MPLVISLTLWLKMRPDDSQIYVSIPELSPEFQSHMSADYLIPLPEYRISISNAADPKLSPDISVTTHPSHSPRLS